MPPSDQPTQVVSTATTRSSAPGVASPPEPNEWRLFAAMFTIRTVEETLLGLFSKGLLFGTVHTCIGQEASAVGIISALDLARDVIWSSHRGHGHYIAATDDVQGLISEIMGKRGGVNSGVGGSQHLHRDRVYTNGVLGGITPCAVGAAFAEKYLGTGAVVAVFLGDGALGEGVVYESLNLASLWSLPVLFVLDDNGYAQSTPKRFEHAGDLKTRAATFGIPSLEVVASDVMGVRAIACDAVRRVRETLNPLFLCVETFRFAPHSKGDDTRSGQELATLRSRDAVAALERVLRDRDARRLESVQAEVRARVSACVERARDDVPLPVEEFVERAARW